MAAGLDAGLKSFRQVALDVKKSTRVIGNSVAPHHVKVIWPDDVEHHVIAAEHGQVHGGCSPPRRVHGTVSSPVTGTYTKNP